MCNPTSKNWDKQSDEAVTSSAAAQIITQDNQSDKAVTTSVEVHAAVEAKPSESVEPVA